MTAARTDAVERAVAVAASLAAFALAAYVLFAGDVGVGLLSLLFAVNALMATWRAFRPSVNHARWLEPKDPGLRAVHAARMAVLCLFLALTMGAIVVVIATVSAVQFSKPLSAGWAVLIVAAAYQLADAMQWRVRARGIRHAQSAADSAPTSPPPTSTT